ncbi:MAG: hypothetical protein E6Q97_09390 [Desulfurellales bacterium]|nr:MAG: hypothetical protein E6Q97_09390 [Desulfurellales bacterium]
MTALSPPEHIADRRARKRIVARLIRDGGCAYCIHRDRDVMGWGRSVCKANHARSFPLCTKDGRKPAFELDEDTLR